MTEIKHNRRYKEYLGCYEKTDEVTGKTEKSEQYLTVDLLDIVAFRESCPPYDGSTVVSFKSGEQEFLSIPYDEFKIDWYYARNLI